MKKRTKKLFLSRETLIHLSKENLYTAKGGLRTATEIYSGCMSGCNNCSQEYEGCTYSIDQPCA
jgi:hypothetical protein